VELLWGKNNLDLFLITINKLEHFTLMGNLITRKKNRKLTKADIRKFNKSKRKESLKPNVYIPPDRTRTISSARDSSSNYATGRVNDISRSTTPSALTLTYGRRQKRSRRRSRRRSLISRRRN